MTEYKRLDEVCTLNMGQSPDSKSYNENKDGVPFFQGNADFGEMYPAVRLWCNSPTKVVESGTLLISVRAPIGALNFATEKSCIGRGLAGITAKEVCDIKYIYYCLKGKHAELNAKGTGSTFKAIAKNELGETLIKIVPLAEQKQVVETIDRVSSIIAARKQQLAALDTLIKARFVEMFGDPKINPNNYPVCQLTDYIKFLTSGSRGWAQYCTDDGSEWFITIKNVKDCRISIENMQPLNAPDNAEAKRTKVQDGDLLISITADLGRTGVVTKEIAEHGAYINQHLTCIRLNKEILNPLYVAFFMESSAGKEQFESKNQSAVKAGLNFNSINSLRLLVPPIDKQKEFVGFVAQVDKSKFVVQKALDEAQLLFDSLMQQYFG